MALRPGSLVWLELPSRASDQCIDWEVVNRDSVEDEVRLAWHFFTASPVVDIIDPLDQVTNNYLCRLMVDEQVFIQVFADNSDGITAVGSGPLDANLPSWWSGPRRHPAAMSHETDSRSLFSKSS